MSATEDDHDPRNPGCLRQKEMSSYMSDRFDAFETLLECLKRMEATLMGMKQIQEYVGKGLGKEMLASLIEEAESQIVDIKRKVIQ
jgi:phosphatidylserine/phosphatidylglycerophosphate/cardiolipin synthase-like enzyme